MLLTQLEYFVAVAHDRHFGRAAAAVHISPSALSESIRKLEAHLGVPLIHRNRTFQGLTSDGERVLVWARRMLADHRSLTSEVDAARKRLQTQIRFGVIPSGIDYGARILSRIAETHPLAKTSLQTGLTSEEIVTLIRQHELDAGLIHPSAADGPDLLSQALYEDRAVLLIRQSDANAPKGTQVTGARLTELSLCLLAPQMRARKILDARMSEHGLQLAPRVEVDSVEALISIVRSGPWAAVVPESAAPVAAADLAIIPLVAPEVFMPITIVRLADEPVSPIAAEIDKATAQVLRA